MSETNDAGINPTQSNIENTAEQYSHERKLAWINFFKTGIICITIIIAICIIMVNAHFHKMPCDSKMKNKHYCIEKENSTLFIEKDSGIAK